MPPPRGVIFDMDGLLVDSEPVHAAAFISAFRHFGLSLEPEEYRQHVTLGGGSTRDLFLSKGGNPRQWEQVLALKRVRFRQHVAEGMELLPGAACLLQALNRRRTPCVLATGAGRATAETILNHFDLWRCFALVLSGDDVRHAKPDPEVFLKAVTALGVAPGECVSLEDSPKGVRAATAAGVRCVAVPTAWTRDGEFTGASLVVDSLVRVTPEVLESLFARSE
ncbi:MAG: HAD family phosphatase [Armatimonadota bacterium]|nr:HAD family phosphatase [Armatimonadota bacterium]